MAELWTVIHWPRWRRWLYWKFWWPYQYKRTMRKALESYYDNE